MFQSCCHAHLAAAKRQLASPCLHGVNGLSPYKNKKKQPFVSELPVAVLNWFTAAMLSSIPLRYISLNGCRRIKIKRNSPL